MSLFCVSDLWLMVLPTGLVQSEAFQWRSLGNPSLGRSIISHSRGEKTPKIRQSGMKVEGIASVG